MTDHLYTDKTLADDAVMKILNAIHTKAKLANSPISAAVSDKHGNLLGFIHMSNASFTSRTIAINKAVTAVGLNMETAALGQIMSEHQLPATHYGDTRITGFGGGLPIVIEDHLVAGIGVSGLTDREDIDFAKAGLASLT